MKKIVAFLMAAAALLAVSCAKEQRFDAADGDLVNVRFTVRGDLATRANSDFATGTHVDSLKVQAFIKDSQNAFQLTQAVITIAPVSGASPLAWDVDMKLARNREYKIAFFAFKSGTKVYGHADLSAVTVDYSKIAVNSDDADAFCAARDLTVAGAMSETVYLYRPLAQINVGTNDWEEYKKSTLAEMQDITVAISATDVPTQLNIIGGSPAADGSVPATTSGSQDVDFAEVSVLDVDDKLVVNSKNYDYFSMVYVLADPAKATMPSFTADFNFGTNPSTDIATVTVTNLPYQANYRTNILGQFLTGNIHYDVEIEPGFISTYTKLVGPEFESVTALNEYLATMLDQTCEGDNGDIDPEEVTVTALNDGETIVLPKIKGDIVIRVNAVCDGTLKMEYANSATDDQKPGTIYLYVKKITNLYANVPASTLVLIDDSWITGTATVLTSGSTFKVGAGAKVGKAEIKQGNAVVDGTVDAVEVAAGASADGQGAPVQLFLSNESSVKEVDLNAKADVVVEQPKDNIDASGTENKVAVVVNEAAAGSSAKAQNGGDIYVKAYGECVVIADGASGDDKSTVTVGVADAPVSATSVGGGEVENKAGEKVDVVDNGVAVIGTAVYKSLAAAVAAAAEDAVITLIADDRVSLSSGGEVTITKPMTITGPVDAKGEPVYTVYGTPAYNGAYNDLFLNSTSGTITVSNLRFSNFSDEVTTSENGRAALFIGSSNNDAVIQNVFISDINTEAIHINGGSFSITDCAFDCANLNEGAFTRGIQVVNDATGSIINTAISNVMSDKESAWTAPIELLGSGNITISGCDLQADEDGYTIGIAAGLAADQPGSSQVTVSDCTVSASMAIYGDGDTGALISISSGVYSGEIVQGKNGKGVILAGGAYTNCSWIGYFVDGDSYAIYTNDKGITLFVFPIGEAPEGYDNVIQGGGASMIEEEEEF